MRILSITHQRDAGAGVFAEAVTAAGGRHDEWAIAEAEEPPGDPRSYDGVMVFGGSMHTNHEHEHPWLVAEKRVLGELLDAGTPLLGVCLGAQLLSEAAGGDARPAREPEIGWFEVAVTDEGTGDPLIGPLAPSFQAFEWHSYECGVPADAVVLACSPVCAQAFRVGDRAWGIQFHAEVSAAEAHGWADDYRADPDAVRIGIDPQELHAAIEPRIEAWNALGRALCARFLEAAARPRAVALTRPP